MLLIDCSLYQVSFVINVVVVERKRSCVVVDEEA